MTRIRHSRRDVLRGLGTLALGPALRASGLPRPTPGPIASIPAVPNRARPVRGLQAYAQKSVAAGEAIDFRISSPFAGDHSLSIVRLGWDTELRTRDWISSSVVLPAPGPQGIRPGSYVHVESALESSARMPAFTVECWVRPFRGPSSYARQGVVTQSDDDDRCGFALGIDDAGRPTAYFGDGTGFREEWLRTAGAALTRLQWHHLAATFEAGDVALYVDGALADAGALSGLDAFTPGLAPLRIGAAGSASGTDFFLDGDVAMPALYGRALDPAEIAARAQRSSPPRVPRDPALLGCWPLAEEGGSTVADASACARDGLVVNHGTWMIGGPSFDASSLPEGYDPDADPLRGHGLRLSGSDLFDCAWPVAHTAVIPEDSPPGIHVGRIEYGEGERYDVTFVVRRPPSRPPAPIVVLCATNTWHAYNKSLDLFDFYEVHAGSQPTYHQGFEMPWSSPVPFGHTLSDADPYVTFPPTPGYSHLVRAERFLHAWLEQNGYDFDLITDRDLHETPDALAPYQVLFVAGHSEYWTREARAKVKDWVAAGGRLVVAAGNTMFWRVTMDGGVLECRKPFPSVGGFADAKPGELFHEHDHDLGGFLRFTGSPAFEVTGLESTGFDGHHVPFEVTNWTHPLFREPEAIDVAPHASGSLATIGGPLAVGHEWDVSLPEIPGHPSGGPPLDVLAQARGDGSQYRFDYGIRQVPSVGAVISEIVEFGSGAGRVFSVGSIAAGQSLHADPKMAALFRNVLHRFGIVFRLHATAIGVDGRAADFECDPERWRAPSSGPGGFGSHPPAGLQFGPDRIASFCVTQSGALLGRLGDASGPGAWTDLGSGGAFLGRPAPIALGRDRLMVFARETGGRLLARTWAPATPGNRGWSDWFDASGTFSSDAAAAAWGGNRASVAALDAGGRVLYRELERGAWGSAWRDLGGGFAFAPTLFAWGGDRLSLFAVDAGGRLLARTRTGGSWSPSRGGWLDLGTPTSGLAGRVHAAFAGHDQATGADTFFVFGVGADGRLKSKQWNGTSWLPSTTGWSDLGGALVGEPAVASFRGRRLCVLAAGADAQLWRSIFDGASWSAWQGLGGSILGSPALFTRVARS